MAVLFSVGSAMLWLLRLENAWVLTHRQGAETLWSCASDTSGPERRFFVARKRRGGRDQLTQESAAVVGGR
jgi:hypothetical protein